MSAVDGHAQVTLSTQAIHNPDEPRHFMRIKPISGYVRVLLAGRVLAASNRALRLLEVGKDLSDPTIYFPPDDLRVALSPTDRRTFCPLKGHATYFPVLAPGGEVSEPEIAWSYTETLDFASELKNRIAFYASRVVIEEHPAPVT
jgi:uncharacterized protein (DUF427 family)